MYYLLQLFYLSQYLQEPCTTTVTALSFLLILLITLCVYTCHGRYADCHTHKHDTKMLNVVLCYLLIQGSLHGLCLHLLFSKTGIQSNTLCVCLGTHLGNVCICPAKGKQEKKQVKYKKQHKPERIKEIVYCKKC